VCKAGIDQLDQLFELRKFSKKFDADDAKLMAVVFLRPVNEAIKEVMSALSKPSVTDSSNTLSASVAGL